MPRPPSHRRQPLDLVAGLFGARGSGKSHKIGELLKELAPPRLLMIDPMEDYGAYAERVDTLAEMQKRSAGEAFALRYVPRLPQKPAELAARFGAFCALAYSRSSMARPLVMVVEEGQLFTRASGAPPDWAHCTLRGRHVGLRIFLASQRPAHIDKDFFTNATWLRTGRLNFEDDIAVMAGALRVPRVAVAGLLGRQWIARDMLTGELTCDPADPVLATLNVAGAAPTRTEKKSRRR